MKISELVTMPVFPFAEEFPMMPEDEIMELAQDLESNGQQLPIILYEGQILDGRNRLSAFQRTTLAEAEAEFFYGTEFQAVEKVRSINVVRRHLTPGQRALAALAYLPYEESEAKKRQEATRATPGQQVGQVVTDQSPPTKAGKARDIVAEKFNLSGPKISEAKKLTMNAPDLAEQVKSGEMALDRATKELKARQEAMERKHRAVELGAIDLYEQYQNGKLSLDDAFIQLINRQRETARKNAAKYNRAIELINNLKNTSEDRLREFNLAIQDLETADKVDEAINHVSYIRFKIENTLTALNKWKIHLSEQEAE